MKYLELLVTNNQQLLCTTQTPNKYNHCTIQYNTLYKPLIVGVSCTDSRRFTETWSTTLAKIALHGINNKTMNN